MFTVNGTEQHNDIVKPLYSVQAILIVSLATAVSGLEYI